MGGGFTWDSCPEVIHIEQILGNYANYAHEQNAWNRIINIGSIQQMKNADDTPFFFLFYTVISPEP